MKQSVCCQLQYPPGDPSVATARMTLLHRPCALLSVSGPRSKDRDRARAGNDGASVARVDRGRRGEARFRGARPPAGRRCVLPFPAPCVDLDPWWRCSVLRRRAARDRRRSGRPRAHELRSWGAKLRTRSTCRRHSGIGAFPVLPGVSQHPPLQRQIALEQQPCGQPCRENPLDRRHIAGEPGNRPLQRQKQKEQKPQN